MKWIGKPMVMLCAVALVAAAVPPLVLPAGAEPAAAKSANAADAAGKLPASDPGVATAQLAMDLAAWARDKGNPAALAVASQVLASVKMHKAKPAKKDTEGPAAAEPAKGQDKPEATPDSLMAQAKEMAGDREDLKAAVESIAKMKLKVRGHEGGAVVRVDRVKPLTTDIWTLRFRGGEVAEVAVIGDGDTDLDLYVFDQNNNLIVSDTDMTDRCFVRWVPKWTGPFKICIKNRGKVYNQYKLLTN